MNLLNKLERKFGKYAIPNLINYILIGYGIGYVILLLAPSLYPYLTLSPSLVVKGQVWRLFTWVLTIPQAPSLFLIFMFLFYYWIGHTLENYWGTFRYNMYMISGYLMMTVGAMLIYGITLLITGEGVSLSMDTYYLNLASFLAFATLFPDTQVYFMMILPIKMKWLAVIDGIYLAYTCLAYFTYGHSATTTALAYAYYSEAIAIILSVLNFIIFFFATRKQKFSPREIHRRHVHRREVERAKAIAKHKCAICGRTSETNPELAFRFCSKCKGNYEYCEDHLFTHQHVE